MADAPHELSRPSDAPSPRRRFFAWIGVGLIVFSGVLFAVLLAVPFLALSNGVKIGLGTGIYAGVQVAWWVGAAFAGPEVVARIKSGLSCCWRLIRRPATTPSVRRVAGSAARSRATAN